MDVNLLEDYPVSFNKAEFESIKSFQGKLDYAVKNLKKIATGSSRAVFAIDDKKALKIAKNKKGLAQNKIEMDAYIQKYGIVAKVFDVDRDNKFWLEMELARKTTPTRFKKFTGISLDELGTYLRFREAERRNRGHTVHNNLSQEDMSRLDNNEFVMDLMSMMGDFNMPAGDLIRLSSYGEIDRDGRTDIVLVDYGLTEEVYNDYYKPKERHNNYRMYYQ